MELGKTSLVTSKPEVVDVSLNSCSELFRRIAAVAAASETVAPGYEVPLQAKEPEQCEVGRDSGLRGHP